MSGISHVERLTRSFYDWERQGRGWQEWPYCVALEPPLRPFLPDTRLSSPFVDDARTSHWLIRLFKRLTARNGQTTTTEADIDQLIPEPVESDTTWIDRELLVPANERLDVSASMAWLASLATCSGPLAFELLGAQGQVSVRLASPTSDDDLLTSSLAAFFPSVVATEPPCTTESLWREARDNASMALEFGLGREFMVPLDSEPSGTDPLAAFIAALATLQSNEIGLLQVLFQEVAQPWSRSIRRATMTANGKPFFADAPELSKQAQTKTVSPLFAVALRIAASAENDDRCWAIIRQIAGGLGQFGTPTGNELIPLGADDPEQLITDILQRTTHRSGMIWSADEVAALVHPPSPSIRCDKLIRQCKKTKAVPAIATGHDFVLGENTHAGRSTTVTLSTTQRLRHTYVIGASGTGKSTMLLNMILQDLERGNGLAVLDPHGDLIDQVLDRLPVGRVNDTVLFDAADEEHPIGFNVLSARTATEKNLLASDLVAVFRRLSTSWGDQMTSVLGNAIIAFLESRDGGTIGDLRRFLVEPEFRRRFLETVSDPEIVYFWQREFPLLTGRPQAPILTRLDTFLRPRLVRHIVCQKETRLDLGAVMNEGRVLLVKLAQGAIGEENAYLLGSLLVSKFHQLALSRQEQREAERRSFYLYIDECHHFVTPSMASILSGARKYRLGLVLANQELRQLGSRDSDMLQSVLTNPCTRICFRVGDDDARKLADGFSVFDTGDLLNLGVGEAIGRVEQAQNDFNLKTTLLANVDAAACANRAQVTERSREQFATPRTVVEAASTPPALPDQSTRAPDRGKRTTAKPEVESPPPSKIQPMPIEAPPSIPAPPDEPMPPMAFPPRAGRGGQQHKYLQHLIKRWAEQRGFKASIEETVLAGAGSVDVVIEHGEQRIACEITVTTTPTHELANVQKCLAAGFQSVIVVAADKKALAKVKEQVGSALEGENLERVFFHTPEELFSHLETIKSETEGGDQTVRGYRVKVEYKAPDDRDAKTRRQAISNVMLKALRRLKGDKNDPGGGENPRIGDGQA